jgi:hypothetical protein
MRPRALLAGALAAALLVTTLALVGAASGGDDRRVGGPLRWSGEVIAFRHPNLPTDYVVTGRVRDDSLRRLRLVARDDIRVVDERGRALPTSAVFTQTFGHGLFDPTRMPQARLPERELMRIGDVGRFDPGDELPVTISWRERPDGPRATRIEYPGGSLAIPVSSRSG